MCKFSSQFHCCALVEELRFFRSLSDLQVAAPAQTLHLHDVLHVDELISSTSCALLQCQMQHRGNRDKKSGDLHTRWTIQLAATASVTPSSNNVSVLESPAQGHNHSLDMCHQGAHVRCVVREVHISPCRCLAGRRNVDPMTQLVRNRLHLTCTFCTYVAA